VVKCIINIIGERKRLIIITHVNLLSTQTNKQKMMLSTNTKRLLLQRLTTTHYNQIHDNKTHFIKNIVQTNSNNLAKIIKPNIRRNYQTTISSTTNNHTRERLLRLEEIANAAPDSAHAQTTYMRELSRAGFPEIAMKRFESGRFAQTASTQAAYNDAMMAFQSSLYSSSSSSIPSSNFTPNYSIPSTNATTANSTTTSTTSLGSIFAAAGAAAANNNNNNTVGESRTNPIYVTMVTDNQSRFAQAATQILVSGAILVLGLYVFDTVVRGSNPANGGVPGAGGNPFSSTGARGSYEVKPLAASEQKTFKDVKGADEAKAELEEVVAFLKNPDKFTALGGKLPRGILMTGPPGTGKTLLAKAVAGEAGVKFLAADGSSFEEMYVGVGARRVRDLFKEARAAAPCVVFIDEIDAVGATRQLKEQQAMKMTLNQLLIELDGFKSSEGIIVLAATNFPELLDSALTRPGRFDRVVAVPLPDVKGRREILQHYLQHVAADKDVNVDTLARATTGMSGADLQNLVNVAAVTAATKNQKSITQKDFEHALDRVMMGVERTSAVVPEQVRVVTAYHEGGHALVALRTEGAMPVFKATIVPRGHALGMVQQLPTETNMMQVSKAQLLASIDVCMAGRVAEELMFGPDQITSGASSDLVKATKIARDMVANYGMMQSHVGVAVVDVKSASPDTLRIVDGEIKAILDASYARVKALLVQHKNDLDRIAKELLDKETLTVDELKQLVGL
jgi:ATP-dependent metalloprotease